MIRTGANYVAPEMMAANNANRIFSNAVNAGASSGNDAAGLSNFVQNAPIPMTLADSPNAQIAALAGSVARSDGGRDAATNFLQNRDADAPQGLKDLTSQYLSPDANSYTATQALTAAQQKAAAPLYDAFRQNAPVPASALDSFQQSPTFQSAVKRANNAILDEGNAPITDASGNITSYTPDTLDRVKQGLDDEWIAAKSSGDAGAARTANNLRSRFVDFMDNQFPSTDANGQPIVGGYAAARNAYSGPAQSKNAIDMGGQFTTMQPDEIASTLKGLSPADQQNFRLGMASKINDLIDQTNQTGGNEAASVAKSTYRQNQIGAAFDSPLQAQQYINGVKSYNQQFQTKTGIIGNSATANRFASDNSLSGEGGGIGMPLIADALGEGKLGSAAAIMASKIFLNKNPSLNAPTAAKLAGMLYNPDQQANLSLLNRVQPSSGAFGYGIAPSLGMTQIPGQLAPNDGSQR